jgi:serine protease Do
MRTPVLLALLLLAAPTWAADSPGTREETISSGTGFFVNYHHIITNEHVVRGCKDIYVRGDVNLLRTFPRTRAKIITVDKEQDLALLFTEEKARNIAVLRSNTGIKVDDPVLVMGYPLEHGQTGDYLVVPSKITAVHGEFNNENRVEFTDSVQQGNSGGPLLDGNGNVIGVIVGMLTYYNSEQDFASNTPSKRSSVAISLARLKEFLQRNGIFYHLSTTYGKIPDDRLEKKGRYTIVNVHCMHGEE